MAICFSSSCAALTHVRNVSGEWSPRSTECALIAINLNIFTTNRKNDRERGLLIGNDCYAAPIAHLIFAQLGMGVRIVWLVTPTEFSRGRRCSDVDVAVRANGLPTLIKNHRKKILFLITACCGVRTPRASRFCLTSGIHNQASFAT